VVAPLRLEELLSARAAANPIVLLHPAPDAIPLSAAMRTFDLSGERPGLILAIGPEGGWSQTELNAHNAMPDAARPIMVTLGPRILRTETAALVAISQILYHIELC